MIYRDNKDMERKQIRRFLYHASSILSDIGARFVKELLNLC
jgi:hypothetical protein